MEHNEIVVNKLDRPVLKNNVKIHGPEKFQLNIGKLQYLSQAEEHRTDRPLSASFLYLPAYVQAYHGTFHIRYP